MRELSGEIFGQVAGLLIDLDKTSEVFAFKNLGPASAIIAKIQLKPLKYPKDVSESDKKIDLKEISLLGSVKDILADQTEFIQLIPSRGKFLEMMNSQPDTGIWLSLQAMSEYSPFEVSFYIRSVDKENHAESGIVKKKLQFIGTDPTRFDVYTDPNDI